MKIIYFTLVFLISQALFSQVTEKKSIIKGSIIEEVTGKPIPGATIKINTTKISTMSDAEGNFILRNIAVGKYELQFSAYSFDTKIISDVETTSNETTNLTVSMTEKNNTLSEVVVKKTKMKAESIASLVAVQKNSSKVQDGISAETIKRTPDKTTSDVLKRISGASIQDNKFVIIRGLNDRYNTSFLNGAPLPSTEPDRKAFSFDIFPANMIDNLVIYKTASPDLSGEFAGGVIEINTKATPEKNFQSLSIGSGYNEITTGKQQIYEKGGKTDWIGADDGTRALPSYFPNTKDFNLLSLEDRIDLSKKYQTNWKLEEKTFAPNTNLQYTLGKFLKVKDDRNFGFLFSLSHSKTNNYNETGRNSYETPQNAKSSLSDKKYNEQVLFGGIANISFKLNANNSFSFKNIYSINSENKIIDRTGFNVVSDNIQTSTTSRLFTSNTIYSGQFAGEHYISESKLKINWVSSLSIVERNTPNDRVNPYDIIPNSDGELMPPSAPLTTNTINLESTNYLYSSINKEKVYNGKFDVSKKIKLSDNASFEIKTGYFNQSRNRMFAARVLGYTPFNTTINGQTYTYDGSISGLPNDQIFDSSNMGILGVRRSGLILFEATKPNDSYTASSDLNAGYLMFDNNYKNLRLIWGARVENYVLKLDAKSDAGAPIIVDNNNTSFLPSANLIYSLNKKQNLRLSFSKTLNRPEFRELAPFLFYDFSSRFNQQGSLLNDCKINNYDFRYEIFPGKGQLFSFSVFYKEFQNPIELIAKANNSNIYKNALSATNRGIELEYRTLLGSIVGSENKFLNDLTFYTNLAVIRSKVDISNLVESTGLIDVPLQGQSPYVFNSGLQYINKEAGWSTSLNINRIGNRISIHGNQTQGVSNPAIWEKSRTFLDGQITKSILKNTLEFKFNIQNILKQDQIFYLNNDLDKTEITGFDAKINELFTGDSQNKNGYNEKEDDLVWITKFGRTFSFSINYNF